MAKVAACATAIGDVTIHGSGAPSTIDLSSVKEIYGDFHVSNVTSYTLLAPNLELVSGELELTGNTNLATLNLAQLVTVGTLRLEALPNLSKTGLTSGITSADSVIVSDTGLSSLDGINVFKLKEFNVNNNDQIESINSGLEQVTDSIYISYNAEKVNVTLDKLSTAKDVYLESISSFSAQNLTAVNGSLSLYSNSMDKVEFPVLKSIDSSLSINKNDDLNEVNFPKLEKVGGAFVVENNDDLEDLSGFPKLSSVGGSVNMTGTFDNATFDSLKKVSGAFYFDTDGNATCLAFKKLSVQGKSKCHASTSSSKSSSKSGKSSKSDSTSKSSSDSGSDSKSSSSGSSSSSKKSEAIVNTSFSTFAAVVATFFTAGIALF